MDDLLIKFRDFLELCFDFITNENISVFGFTILDIAFINFILYCVFRFILNPLLGDGFRWGFSSINFSDKSDSVDDGVDGWSNILKYKENNSDWDYGGRVG